MTHPAWDIRPDDLSGEATRALVRLHLEGMRASSPPGSVFALDLAGLTAADVSLWSAWAGDAIAGIGALKDLGVRGGAAGGLSSGVPGGAFSGGRCGEIKSMRTHPNFLRRGVAAALLEHIIGVARVRGMTRLSLETGSGTGFEPALSLYRRRGFVDGEAFSDYERSAFNQFLHLRL